MVRTELLKTVAKSKGWVLEGFPENANQLLSFKTYQYNPHLVIILDDDEENLLTSYQLLKEDPVMGKKYESVNPDT